MSLKGKILKELEKKPRRLKELKARLGNDKKVTRLMDELVREYPRYADAYVNLAYVRFAMNPAENRDEAILYYRHGLTLGAARDPRLELELRLDVTP